jgi:hypothetical protein
MQVWRCGSVLRLKHESAHDPQEIKVVGADAATTRKEVV